MSPVRPALGLSARVFFATAGIVGAVLVAGMLVASLSLRSAADEAVRRGLDQSADLVAQFLAGRQRSLAGGASVFARNPYFRAIVAAQRRDDVLDQTFEAAEQLEAAWVFITDARGVLMAKSDEPSTAGSPMGEVPLVAGALHGQTTSGFGVSRDSLLFQAVAVPIALPERAPIGVLVATRLVDSLLVSDLRAATGGEVLFYTLDDAGRARVAASTLGRGSAADTLLRALTAPWRDEREAVTAGGVAYLAQGGATTTAGGTPVGGYVVLRDRDEARARLAGMRRSLVVASVVGLALALLAAWAAARRVTRPVRALAAAARSAAEGDYAVAARLGDGDGAGSADREIAALGAAFRDMLADLREKAALDALRAVATAPPGSAPESPAPGEPAAPRALRPRATTLPLRRAAAPAPRHAVGAIVEPGHVIGGRYAVEAMIGVGGIGIVYRVIDRVLDETLALKLLRPEVAAADPGALERFKDELRLARRLAHRNVVRVHDFGESDGVPFLTMEYVPGASLAALLRARGALPETAVVSVAKQLARALDAAHAQGVVHGDVKPANLLVGPGGVLKVSDFGLARLVRVPHADPAGTPPHIAGAVVGTPAYMAPELLLGAAPDERSDLYAVGMVLHECLTGDTPFDADTPVAFFARKLDPRQESATPPPPAPRPTAHGAERTLAALVAQLVARDPAERVPSARALYEALSRLP